MRVPPIYDFAETFSQISPWREVKGKPAALSEGTAGIGRGINERIIGEYQSHSWESGNALSPVRNT